MQRILNVVEIGFPIGVEIRDAKTELHRILPERKKKERVQPHAAPFLCRGRPVWVVEPTLERQLPRLGGARQ